MPPAISHAEPLIEPLVIPPADAWRGAPSLPSLSEVYRSIPVLGGGTFWRRLFAFAGPGFLVAVGYMDPGNWATSLAGGSAYGYNLLVVVMVSNLMAILLQALAARLGIATGRDLAQACRDHYSPTTGVALWLLCEIAIIATDLAEVIGTAIALNLLFGIPLTVGVVITALDVVLLLALQNLGFRWIEAFIVSLVAVIAACFGYELLLSQPSLAGILGGLLPKAEIVTNPGMLYIAIGIIGATVMPHNLYLHSAIVQTRSYEQTETGRREAIRFASIDSTVALMFALLVNGAILILAASAFHSAGRTEVAEIQDAFHLLAPILGVGAASTVFAVALLACGLNSTVTATLAGQIVMEGFLNLRLPPWLRRLITRGIAVVPAVFASALYGENGTAQLLILSQVVLSLQLPFAIIPLVMFTGDRAKMGRLVAPRWMTALAWIVAAVVVVLNLKLLWDVMVGG
ncbi:MAG: Mn(2+) uptake NRAMP transporter MntH [Azospirillum sp.]|nr:Mn(2+) uptake NRAMP transporter MntH [Azospirillum sp.]